MSQRTKRGVLASLGFMLVLGLTVALVSALVGGSHLVVHADPTGIKYTGAGACSAAACHGAAAPKEEEACRHNENTMWSDKDQHSKAFNDPEKGLVGKKADGISATLKLGAAAKAERCLTCHALSGLAKGGEGRVFLKPGDIDPAKYNVADGNSCDACHGPAEKYMPKHTEKGWTAGQRKAVGSQKLYDDMGLYDTKNLKWRANQCLSCHLKIDADMVAAGHPELSFELDSMTNPDEPWKQDWVHWRKGPPWFSGKVWAMGQVVSLRHAALQLADRTTAKAAAPQLAESTGVVIAHALNARQIAKVIDAASQGAIDAQLTAINAAAGDAAKTDAACKELAKVADALADKVNEKAWDQATTEALLKGVASEGEQAAKGGYKAAEQYTIGVRSLWNTIANITKPADAKAKGDAADALYTPLGDPTDPASPFKPDDFATAAKGIAGLFPGGASIPLPK